MPEFTFDTTHIGSVPHLDTGAINALQLSVCDIPAWMQMVRRDFRENIYTQYAPSLPGAVIDEDKQKAYIDFQADDFDHALERFYQSVIDENKEAFALKKDFAWGFYALLDSLQKNPTRYVKGHVMGPISFGLTVTDQDGRPCLYNDVFIDVLIKHMTFNAFWQIGQLGANSQQVLLFVDEPYMASFGSAYINLSKEQVVTWLDDVYEPLKAAGAVTGTHCCGNTDWSVLLGTKVDILNLDAYDFIDNLALYPIEIREFLDRGGAICWGLIPNNEHIFNETPQSLAKRFREGLKLICEKAKNRGVNIQPDEFASHSIIAPACGLGPASVEVANRAFEMLPQTAEILKKG